MQLASSFWVTCNILNLKAAGFKLQDRTAKIDKFWAKYILYNPSFHVHACVLLKFLLYERITDIYL